MMHRVYRYRGWISAIMACILWVGVPLQIHYLWLLLLIPAVLLRIWARQYIGSHSRGFEWDAPQLVVGGPYRYLHHPLYISNGLMGVSLAFYWGGTQGITFLWSFFWVAWYCLLAFAENRYLQHRWGDSWSQWEGRAAPERTFGQAFRADVWTWIWLGSVFAFIEWMAI